MNDETVRISLDIKTALRDEITLIAETHYMKFSEIAELLLELGLHEYGEFQTAIGDKREATS